MLKIKNISRPVIILGFISFFTDIASEMIYPVMPLFMAGYLGTSMAVIGLIEGIAEFTAGILKGYFGSLSDKLGKRSVFVTIGYGLSAVAKPLPGLIPHLFTVVTMRVADRIGKGIRTAPRDALLASYAKGNTGAVFGFHRGMDTLGAMTGPLAAILLLYLFPGNYPLVFLAAFIPSVFAVALTFYLRDPETKITSKKRADYKTFWANAPSEYKILFTLFVLFSFVNSSDVFLILKSKEISRSDGLAIFGYVFYNFIYAAFSYPVGLAADKFGKKKLFVAGLVIFSLVYLGFAFNSSLWLIWVLFAFYGIYAAATEGVAKAWVSDLISDEFRGRAIGMLTASSGIAVMAGSAFTGILWDMSGPRIPFLISSVVSLIIAAAFLLLIKKPR